MSDEQRLFLGLLGRPPLRLTVEQTAWVLNCGEQDVRILVQAKLLKLLGSPAPNGQKYFSTADVLALASDRNWLDRATNAIYRYWQAKNRQRDLLPRGRNGTDADELRSAA